MTDDNYAVVQKYALAIAGMLGVLVVLYRFVTTGELQVPAMTVFTGLLGFSSMTHGATTS